VTNATKPGFIPSIPKPRRLAIRCFKRYLKKIGL
jgi:hypothetical protein